MRSGRRPECSIVLSVQRQALVDPGEVKRVLDAELGQQRVVGELLDHEHDLAEMLGELRGQAGERGAGERLDLVGGGGDGRDVRVHGARARVPPRPPQAAPLASAPRRP